MNDISFSLDLFRETARTTGKLTLGQHQAERLLELAKLGLEAKRGIITSRKGLPEAVAHPWASEPVRRPRRKTRVRGMEA